MSSTSVPETWSQDAELGSSVHTPIDTTQATTEENASSEPAGHIIQHKQPCTRIAETTSSRNASTTNQDVELGSSVPTLPITSPTAPALPSLVPRPRPRHPFIAFFRPPFGYNKFFSYMTFMIIAMIASIEWALYHPEFEGNFPDMYSPEQWKDKRRHGQFWIGCCMGAVLSLPWVIMELFRPLCDSWKIRLWFPFAVTIVAGGLNIAQHKFFEENS